MLEVDAIRAKVEAMGDRQEALIGSKGTASDQ
jgi:hypothetical protein